MLIIAADPESLSVGNAAELILNTPTVSISITVLKPCRGGVGGPRRAGCFLILVQISQREFNRLTANR